MKVSIYVSVYAVLREFRPIDPFFIQYLMLLPEKHSVQTVSLFKLKIKSMIILIIRCNWKPIK